MKFEKVEIFVLLRNYILFLEISKIIYIINKNR